MLSLFEEISISCETLQQNLKCSYCNQVLSVRPIYREVTIGNICGRCVDKVKILISSNVLQRATAFESLAMGFKFRCDKAVACDTLMQWSEVSHHEVECNHKIECPYTCDIPDISTNNLPEYLLAAHKNVGRRICNGIICNIDLDDKNCLINAFNQTFLLQLNTLKGTRNSVYVRSTVKTDCSDVKLYLYRYRILLKCRTCSSAEISNTMKVTSLISRGVNYTDVIKIECHCFDSIYGIISIYKESVSADPSSTQEQNHQAIANLINKYQMINPNSKALLVDSLALPNLGDAHILSCTACYNFMKGPIYHCAKYHNFCEECKTDKRICPTCQSELTSAQDFQLQSVSEFIQVSCIYEQFGCAAKLNKNNWNAHNQDCEFRTLDCPICKDMVCLMSIKNHLEKKHPHLLFNADDTFFIPVGRISLYWTCTASGDIFVLKSQIVVSSIGFECLHINTSSDQKRSGYKFHLQFANVKGLKIVIEQQCKEDVDQFGNNPVVLPFDLLGAFVTEGPYGFLNLKCAFSKIE